jgi:phosphoribosylformylglycinamidine synthase
VACTGARPLGITDCLNFGNPERPAVFYQFREACRGIADACRALGTPVTGGNVSFYNESPTGAVDPTPVVGMIGLLARADRAVPSHARANGDVVFVLGETRAELGGSAYWEVCEEFMGGQPPRVDLEGEKRLIELLVTGAERGLFRSAHDCSHGGLGVALAEVAMGGPYQQTGFGMEIDLTLHAARLTPHEVLFSESHGRAVISCSPDRAAAVQALAGELGVPLFRAGTVGPVDGAFRIALRDGQIEESVARLRDVYFSAIPRRMGD